MWLIMFLILAVIIENFLWDRYKQIQKVSREGGMINKYHVLIDRIKNLDDRIDIYRLSSESIVQSLSNIGGTTVFSLTQTFSKIKIVWKIDNPIFGKHELKWRFDEYNEQDKMFEKITHDMAKYQKNVFSAQGHIE